MYVYTKIIHINKYIINSCLFTLNYTIDPMSGILLSIKYVCFYQKNHRLFIQNPISTPQRSRTTSQIKKNSKKNINDTRTL